MDVATLRKRLIARDSVVPTSAANVTHVARAFLALGAQDSSAGVSQGLDSLLIEINRVELEYARLAGLSELSKVETEYFAAEEKKIDEDIEKAKGDILDLKSQLKDARMIRQRNEDLEVLAHQVQQEPPRLKTENEIEELRNTLARLKQQQSLLDEQFSLRKRQFQLLVHAVAELNSELNM